MKDEEAQSSAATSTPTSSGVGAKKKGSLLLKSLSTRYGGGGGGGSGGGGQYKLWVLAAILLLAFWSMFTGSVTLKWSTITLPGDFDPRINNDLDILEVEEREKLVKHMWDVYTQSKSIQLPKFWQVAFKAAYMNLISEASNVRDAAFYEIAKMSFHRSALLKHHLVPPSSSSSGTLETTKEAKPKSEESGKTKTRRLR